MGSFSWNKADALTAIENVAYGSPFKFLIPLAFGGGSIKDHYQDYGHLSVKQDGSPKYDMYELLACWNAPTEVKYNGDYCPMKEMDEHTEHNRGIGIRIGCHDHQMKSLPYPLKLVSVSFKGAYEDLDCCSVDDPDQGFFSRKR